jgi:hypothetical protein
MAASRKTRKYIARRLTPTIAVASLPDGGDSARDDPLQRVMKELRSAGYVPRFQSELMENGTLHVGGNGKAPAHEASSTNGTAASPGLATEPKKRRASVGRPAKTGTR